MLSLRVGLQLLRADALRASRASEHASLLSGRTLEEVACALPEALWAHYEAHGWLRLEFDLSKRERRVRAAPPPPHRHATVPIAMRDAGRLHALR